MCNYTLYEQCPKIHLSALRRFDSGQHFFFFNARRIGWGKMAQLSDYGSVNDPSETFRRSNMQRMHAIQYAYKRCPEIRAYELKQFNANWKELILKNTRQKAWGNKRFTTQW